MFHFVVAIFLLAILFHYIKSFLRLRQLGVPFRIGFPLVYRLPYVVRTFAGSKTISPLDRGILEMTNAGGDMIAFKPSLFSPVTILSANAEVNKHILLNVDNYVKGETMLEVLKPFLGDGIFNTNGQRWLDQRKHAAFMFAKRELKKMVDIFLAHFEFMKKRLNKGEPVEMQGNPTFHLFSTTRCQRLILLWLLQLFVVFLFFVSTTSESSKICTAG